MPIQPWWINASEVCIILHIIRKLNSITIVLLFIQNISKFLKSSLPRLGDIPGNSWWECAAWFTKNATLHVYMKQKLCHHSFLKSISNCILHFLSYSFGIETTNTLIHNRSSFANHTWYPDQNGQNLYPFSDLNGAKTLCYLLRRHIPVWLIFNNYSSSPNGLWVNSPRGPSGWEE